MAVSKCAIILAAGLGTRMKSKKHKVLHEVGGKPMVLHILDALEQIHLTERIVVIGQAREQVQKAIGDRASYAVQDEQLGTGHAVQMAAPLIPEDAATTLVLYGDAPLIRPDTLQAIFDLRAQTEAAVVVLTARVSNPTGLGRIERSADGQVARIVEEKDADEQVRQIHEINTGIYAFRTDALRQALGLISNDNAGSEYYLTDTLAILRDRGETVLPLCVDNADETVSVNDRIQLAQAEHIWHRWQCQRWMQQGVTIIDPETTFIDADVTIGRDTILYPGTYLQGASQIGEDCLIGPNVRLSNVQVDAGVQIEQSVLVDSTVGRDTSVGPFAYVRPGSTIGAAVKIGDFVEVKKSAIGDGTKVSHLAYVGDAVVGQRVNIGCGVITVNYDGQRKHQTTIGDDSFIGSNVNLIAPLRIGQGAYLCAGSTIAQDVPDDGFAIARDRQVTKPNYVLDWKARNSGKTDPEGM